jgi:hypothetical protein
MMYPPPEGPPGGNKLKINSLFFGNKTNYNDGVEAPFKHTPMLPAGFVSLAYLYKCTLD